MIMAGTGKPLMVFPGLSPRLDPLPPPPSLLCADSWQTPGEIVASIKAKRTAACKYMVVMLTGDLKNSGPKKKEVDKLWTEVTKCVYLVQAGGDDTAGAGRARDQTK